MKTFVYFASGGRLKEEYDTLPFDRVILIDKSGDGVNWHRLDQSKKVLNWKVECNISIDKMLEEDILLDAIMIKNEGLGEGGGDYPLFGRSFFSRVLPLLKDKTILVTQMNHYGDLYAKLIDKLPITLEKIDNTEYQSSFGNDIDVFEIKRIDIIKEVSSINETDIIYYQNKSIWEDKNQLDALFIKVSNCVLIEQITGVRREYHADIVTESHVMRTYHNKYYKNIFFIQSDNYEQTKKIIENNWRFKKIGFMDCFEEIESKNSTIGDMTGRLDIEGLIKEISTFERLEKIFIYKF